MKIGLYFGSFNPVHTGHLIIASHIQQFTELNQVWFVVSPQNPLKPSVGLLNEYHRFNLVQLAIEGEENRFRPIDIEFRLPKPSYTVNTMAYLTEKYPSYQFAIIMGSDGFQNIERWKNYEHLLSNFPIYIYPRPGFETTQKFLSASIQIVKAPLLDISATHIRDMIKKGLSIRYLVPEEVRKEIERSGYYKT